MCPVVLTNLKFLLAYGVAFALGGESSSNAAVNIEDQASDAWRRMFAFGGILAGVQFVGMLCMPESPVWLHERGRTHEANLSRNRIRGDAKSDRGIAQRINDGSSGSTIGRSQSLGIEMSATCPSPSLPPPPNCTSSFVEEEHPHTQSHQSKAGGCLMRLLIRIRSAPSRVIIAYQRLVEEVMAPYWRQWAIATFLAASQQLCGHPSVLSFSAEIFGMLSTDQSTQEDGSNMTGGGDSAMTPMELTVGIGVLKFLTTCIVILFIERGGRRTWLLSGMICILISLTFLCMAFVGPPSVFRSDLGIFGIYGVAIGTICFCYCSTACS